MVNLCHPNLTEMSPHMVNSTDGYLVSTVGVNTEIIKRYIENQSELDAAQTTKLFD